MAALHASIDIGSNSAKLLIARRDNNSLIPLVERLQSVRIGADGDTLLPQTAERLRAALIRFRQSLSNTGAQLERVVLTGAARTLSNPEPLLATVQSVLQTDGEIITGDEEARLTWLAVRHSHGQPGFLCLDVGAGSSELSTQKQRLSIPIGALTLSQQHGAAPHPGEMRTLLAEQLAQFDLRRFAGRPAFISGGSACAVASLALGQSRFSAPELEGFSLDFSLLDRIALRLRNLSHANRNALPGLDDGRGAMVISGIHLIEAFLQQLRPPTVQVSTLGLRYGLLVDQLLPPFDDPDEIELVELPQEEPPPSKRRRSARRKSGE